MRQEKIKINIYNYEDLLKNDILKEKVLNNWRNKYDDFYDDCILEDYETIIEDLGYNGVKIYYSGFWSQGDGACFVCESVDLNKIIERMEISIRLGLKDYIVDNLGISIKHNSRYYHYRSVKINYDFDNRFIGDLTEEYCNEIVEKIIDFIDEDIFTYSDKVYRRLEDEWDYQKSDEYILEMIDANDYEFTEDGKIY